MGSLMWEFSLYCDRQMQADDNWIDSHEGLLSMRLIERENDRLAMLAKTAAGKDDKESK